MDYKTLFEALNERLKAKERQLTIICGGGFALTAQLLLEATKKSIETTFY